MPGRPARLRRTACLALIAMACALPAVDLPLDRLGDQAVRTALGSFEVQAWLARDGFPDLDLAATPGAKPTEQDARRWETPGGGASMAIRDGALEFGLRGRNQHGEVFSWLPTVAFVPDAPGTFAVTGTLALKGGGKGDGIIAWALCRLLSVPGEPPEVAVVLTQSLARAATIDLATLPELRAIKVAPGERLLLAVWRPAWHEWGAGTLRGLAIERLP